MVWVFWGLRITSKIRIKSPQWRLTAAMVKERFYLRQRLSKTAVITHYHGQCLFMSALKSAEKPEVKEFVVFYLKNALLLVKETHFFPLPPRAYTTMLGHFNKKRVGTVFNGVPIIGLTIDELIRREERLQYENY